MVKFKCLICTITMLILFSCTVPTNHNGGNSGNGGNNNGHQDTKANVKISISKEDLSRAVSINQYEVKSLDIIIKNNDETEIKANAVWSSSDGDKVYEFQLEWNKTYKLYVTHNYTDNEGNEKTIEEGPYEFTVKKGYVTEIEIIPGGVTTIVDNDDESETIPCYIIGFQPSYTSPLADQESVWIDILVTDAEKFKNLGNIIVSSANNSYINQQMSGSEISSWNIQDNQVIRIHDKYYPGNTDTEIGENNPDKWDFKTTSSYSINWKHGLIYIEDESGKLIDLAAYTTDNNTGSDWLSGTGPTAVIQSAVDSGLWGGVNIVNAFDLGDTDTYNASLVDTTQQGDSKDDWQQVIPGSSGYSLSGTISLNNTGIEGVTVSLENTNYTCTSLSDGSFSLTGIQEGEYTILTSLSNYAIFPNNYSRSITVNSNVTGVEFTGVPETKTAIHDIQGETHSSSYKYSSVTGVIGVVTGVTGSGFYIQDVDPDTNDSTSEGILIYLGSSPSVSIGDLVAVDGTVSEYIAGGSSSGYLSITEITSPSITSYSTGYNLPEPVLLGNGGRTIPTEIICDDTTSNVLNSTFDPENDGIDLYESVESMLVSVNNALVVGPTNNYGEIAVVADNGENASVFTSRGGLIIQDSDYNPEIIRIDDTIAGNPPDVNVGDSFNDTITGIMDYAYGYFEIINTEALPSITTGSLAKETTTLSGDTDSITIASYNVENLSAVSETEKIESAANDIVNNLGSPDIVGLIEIQDNNGTDTGVTDASETYQAIINKITQLGGPVYDYRDIAPVEDQDGGVPGGNIRCGLIFNVNRVSFVDRSGGDSVTPVTVSDNNGEALISFSPGRIDPENTGFEDSRKSLIGEFEFNNEKIYVIVNHFKSKSGDTPLFGYNQPPVLGSEEKRLLQAEAIGDFVQEILAIESDANIVVLGDLNDFQFSESVEILEDAGLYNLHYNLPYSERYSYNYQGNSQTLDHILISSNLQNNTGNEFDIVHICSEYAAANRTSDHDPLISKFSF